MFHKYKVELVKVIDGDTVKLKVDCGFRLTFTDNFRLAGIDTPEIRGEERQEGLKAKDHLARMLFKYVEIDKKQLWILSQKHGKFRWLADLYVDDIHINKRMLEDGFATEY